MVQSSSSPCVPRRRVGPELADLSGGQDTLANDGCVAAEPAGCVVGQQMDVLAPASSDEARMPLSDALNVSTPSRVQCSQSPYVVATGAKKGPFYPSFARMEMEGQLSNAPSINGKLASNMAKQSGPDIPHKHAPTMEEVIAFGGIPIPAVNQRCSSRIQGQFHADATQMERAMMNAQARNIVGGSGKKSPPPHSILSFDDNDIVNRAQRIGVSLGVSMNQALESVKNIKAVEEERTLTMLQKNISDSIDGDIGPSNLLVSKVSNLCDDLVEDEEDEVDLGDKLDHLIPNTHPKKNSSEEGL